MSDDSGASDGKVYLVGAGPGDPGLLTARALELIGAADVILYDRLIPASALAGARADAELLFVGKEGGGPSVPQEQTEALMIERAQAGGTIVRLKGGDPFVFGRGGEEALALRAAGIEFEVVPGVTAGVAASAYAGIPVTHRGLASAVALVTGHAQDEARGDTDEQQTAIDWPALAAFPGTLVFYMGVRRLPEIAASLIACGRPGSQAAAVVEAGTLPRQRTVSAHARDDRRDGRARGHSPAVDHDRRARGRARRRARVAAAAPACRRERGGDASARAGERARAAPGGARRQRDPVTGDPRAAAARPRTANARPRAI